MDFTHQSAHLGGGIIYWPSLVHDETCSYVNFECSIDDGILPNVQVRDVIMGAVILFGGFAQSLSAPSAKLNVAGANFSFEGRENKS